jgi:AcrR family transcriptional regulator
MAFILGVRGSVVTIRSPSASKTSLKAAVKSAVARDVGIAATSVYIHFADRNALVFAALEQCTADLMRDLDRAESAAGDAVSRLRARLLFLGMWVGDHAGLYKVLHESTLNQRMHLAFKEELGTRTTAAVQRCMDAGLAPADEAAVVALDLRAAVHGAVSMRVNEPGPPACLDAGELFDRITPLRAC